MKIDIMRRNPNICFEIEALHDMANWKTVIGWAMFEELAGKSERKAALQKLQDRHLPMISSQITHLYPSWPFPPSALNLIEGVMYRFELKDKSGRFEKIEVSLILLQTRI
jgi:hypothetical protein